MLLDQARKKDLLSTTHLDVMAINIGKNWRAFGMLFIFLFCNEKSGNKLVGNLPFQ